MHDLSPAAERALEAAHETSSLEDVCVRRLLQHLLQDEEARPAQRLLDAGANLHQIRLVIEAMAEQPIARSRLLRAARNVAREQMESTVTGEYLLVALLTEIEGLSQAFAEVDVDIRRLLGTESMPPIEVGMQLEAPLPDELQATHRGIDANANRVRESLRILDDYCRFVRNDALMTEQVKRLRHDFVEAMAWLNPKALVTSRDTPQDVGTTISTTAEMVRARPAEVALVNWKRLQESLRSIEEFGKVVDSEFARRIEQIRYRSYTLEKACRLIEDASERLQSTRLYVLLTGETCLASLEWTIQEAAAGGVEIFQLREKKLPDRELLQRARDVRRWTRTTQTLMIMNDRPDIARLVEADGVHLGQDDMTISEARAILGPEAIIGVSTHSREQLDRAVLEGADYIGLGPTFVSRTKDFAEFPGLDYLRLASERTTLPAFAIGGITLENLNQVIATGIRRVAVSAAIAQAEEPRTVATAMRAALNP